jgi:ribonuclease E
MGFIVRTAGNGARKGDLQRDLRYLKRLWKAVEDRIKKAKAPAMAYQESDIVIRCMRDVFAPDIEQIIIDHEEVARRASEFLRMVSPSHRKRVKLYKGAEPLFHKFGVEQAIQDTFSNHVSLPSGGSLVIEQCEALVAIDVNSGKYTDEDDVEDTAFRTNMEAAAEACRQLRLRDLGGVIVIDFIDMRLDKHRRKVERTVADELKRDRARSRWLRMSRFGLMQITRQRVRQGTKRALYDTCPVCRGSGLVRGVESMIPHVMRQIRVAVAKKDVQKVEVVTHPDVADRLGNDKRQSLLGIEEERQCSVRILAAHGAPPGQCEVTAILKSGKKLKI